jgi:hypothetical protein
MAHPIYPFDIHKLCPINREDFWLCDRYISNLDEAFNLTQFWMCNENYIGWTSYGEYLSRKSQMDAIFDFLKDKDSEFNPMMDFVHFDNIKDLKSHLDKKYKNLLC